jgi:hypothetical protein
MFGPLTLEERQALRRMGWSEPVRKYQYLVFGGLAVWAVAWGYLAYSVVTGAIYSGNTSAYEIWIALFLAGATAWVVGVQLRRRVMRRITIRACDKCGELNFVFSNHCRKCGAALSPR